MRLSLSKLLILWAMTALSGLAEVHTMTLDQALTRALSENPDVVLARLDVARAKAQTQQVRDPFTLKVGIGGGYAYTYGMPATIDGNAPSIFQSRAQMALYDKPAALRVEQSREAEKGSSLDVALRQQDVAYKVASAFLDAEHAERSATAAQRQHESLRQVQRYTDVRVAERVVVAIEAQRANLNVLTAQNTAEEFAYAATNAEIALAQMLGYPAGDRVRPALEERPIEALPISRELAATKAIADNSEIRRLESNLRAKQLEVQSFDAAKRPRVNLFGQQAVLAKFNNFADYYPRFQRNNIQIGVSVEIPIFTGSAPSAGKAMAQTDIDKLRVEITRVKSRVTTDIDQTYRDVERAEQTRNLRRASLDLAREEVSVTMKLYDEERGTMAQVEAARAQEQEAWIRYYDAQHTVELARLNVRRTTGTILATLP
jgi:outer membrane protein